MNSHLPFPLTPNKPSHFQSYIGNTPLVSRRLENRQNIRALIFGDSISAEPLMGEVTTGYGVLRLLQNHIGNAGAGGYNVNVEAFPTLGNGAVSANSNWFRTYTNIPAAGWMEFSHEFQSRRFCDTVKFAWKNPVGGTATFKIQTCADADGAGVGTWVDQGGVRTAVASGSEDEIGYAEITLTEGSYRARILGVSGTVSVVHSELSHSSIGGCIINYQGESGTEFTLWRDLSENVRKTFMDAVDPDVIFVMFKDGAAPMVTCLEALKDTLEVSRNGDYPRDVVIIPPFPNSPESNEFWMAAIEQRNVMRNWALANKAAFIDLWDLFPNDIAYYDGAGIHAAGVTELAYQSALILDHLGWLRYPTVESLTRPPIRTTRKATYHLLPNSTTLVEDASFRIPVGEGLWRITGRFLFTSNTTGEGGKIQIAHTGVSNLVNIAYTRCQVNGNPQLFVWPYHGGFVGMPVLLQYCTTMTLGYGYDLQQLDISVIHPGVLTVSVAKEATGADVYFREGSYIKVEKI